MKERLEDIRTLYQYLRGIDVPVKTVSHPPVVSCEESKQYYDELGYDERYYGLCKNIFIRDKKGKHFWLVIVDYRKMIDMSELMHALESTKKLALATQHDLMSILGVEPGSVSIFSILKDTAKEVKVVIDRDLMYKDTYAFHPCYSGLTSFISKEDTFKFLESLDIKYRVMSVPGKDMTEHERQPVKSLAFQV